MLNISDKIRDKIFYAGVALLLMGGALAYWALQHFDALPNHLRLASLLPVMSGAAMLQVDNFRNWSTVHGLAKGRAIGTLIAPPMLLLGAALWWFIAPDARA
ncbi:hypothetical protein [Arenimonas daejeonensis]|uniref:hypothetical protein n=1 Tax=Arenimonas daejeonensis TaxID=370777 RepID=UPI0011BFD4D6|nr:hypothetical protein [Arenimonas daejeonensis]